VFVLGQALAMFDSLGERILECDAKIEAPLKPLGVHEVELSGPGKRGSFSSTRDSSVMKSSSGSAISQHFAVAPVHLVSKSPRPVR